MVDEISAELQERKVHRGNIAQLRHQENLIIEIIKLGIKVEMIARKKGVNYLDRALIAQVFGKDFVPAVTARSWVVHLGHLRLNGWEAGIFRQPANLHFFPPNIYIAS